MDIVQTNEDINSLMKDYKKKKKKYRTNPKLTKYEKTRIISERANQIDSGSPSLISNPDRFTTSIQIAFEELNQEKIPFIIKRKHGNTYEYWKLKDLL